MNKYLLDTNICIYYLNGLYNLKEKIQKIKLINCFISEITVAELKFGVENSEHKKDNRELIEKFISSVQVVPIINCLDFYAKEKSRLRKTGNMIDDFDLLIGSTAVENNLVLVTKNTSHFERITAIVVEDWTIDQDHK